MGLEIREQKKALEGSPFWLKSVYNDVWKHIDLRTVWSAMENSLNKESTPLAQYDSIRLSLKKFRNLGEISNKHNADQQRAFLLEEQREQQSVSRSPSPTGQMDFNPTVHYRWQGSHFTYEWLSIGTSSLQMS